MFLVYLSLFLGVLFCVPFVLCELVPRIFAKDQISQKYYENLAFPKNVEFEEVFSNKDQLLGRLISIRGVENKFVGTSYSGGYPVDKWLTEQNNVAIVSYLFPQEQYRKSFPSNRSYGVLKESSEGELYLDNFLSFG